MNARPYLTCSNSVLHFNKSSVPMTRSLYDFSSYEYTSFLMNITGLMACIMFALYFWSCYIL